MNGDAPEFPEYAIKYSTTATESRQSLPTEFLPTLDAIVNGLAMDPEKYPDRIERMGRKGDVLLYTHPNPELVVTYEIDEDKKVIYFFKFQASALSKEPTIFVSYSHEDKEWLETLKKYLRQGVVEFWDDTQIEAGESWQDEIEKALAQSESAMLLVSQDFLDSKFISEVELPKMLLNAQREGKKIFWIHLSPSTVFDDSQYEPITAFQALHEDPHTALSEHEETERQRIMVEMNRRLKKALAVN